MVMAAVVKILSFSMFQQN